MLSFERNLNSTPIKKLQKNNLFVLGLILSCIGESLLIWYSVQTMLMHYQSFEVLGIGFFSAVLSLGIGNAVLLACRVRNVESHFL